jgi:hypothetical protein
MTVFAIPLSSAQLIFVSPDWKVFRTCHRRRHRLPIAE